MISPFGPGPIVRTDVITQLATQHVRQAASMMRLAMRDDAFIPGDTQGIEHILKVFACPVTILRVHRREPVQIDGSRYTPCPPGPRTQSLVFFA